MSELATSQATPEGSVPAAPQPAPVPAELDQLLQEERARLQQLFPLPPPRAPRRRRAALGAALTLAAAAAGLLWADPAWRTEQFAADLGPPRPVQLADGSHLVLDSQANVQVSWHLRSRRVELRQGRVHFEVAHSAWRPFTVDAAQARVTVLGTVFDIDLREQAVEVTLWQGRVEFSEPVKPVGTTMMAPGDRLRLAWQGSDSSLQRLAASSPEEQGWTQGRLVFRRTPLAEVARELQRYRQAPLHIDAAVAQLQLSGVFDSARAEQLIDLLPRVLPVTVRRSTDGEAWIVRRAPG